MRRTPSEATELKETQPDDREIVMAGSDAETIEEAVISTLINRAMEVVIQDPASTERSAVWSFA